jgi:hypothetical protein
LSSKLTWQHSEQRDVGEGSHGSASQPTARNPRMKTGPAVGSRQMGQHMREMNYKIAVISFDCMVCSECSKMNGFCSLIKVDDEYFQKHSRDIRWIEFDENWTD